MTNKEYKEKREQAENVEEVCAFEHELYNGWFCRNSRYMTPEDISEMRQARKEEKKQGAIMLEGFNNRAAIIPVENGYILRSYYTDVCAVLNGYFVKLWDGFSVTTLKHINAFCHHFKLDGFSKREWIELETASGDIVDGETGEILLEAA